MKTLAGYRTFNDKIMFGQNLLLAGKSGTIKTGDCIEILKKK